MPGQPAYVAVVLIDPERRVTYDAPMDFGRPARFQGYVSADDGGVVEIILTDRSTVIRMHCLAQSTDQLGCYIERRVGHSPPLSLTRVGPAPATLRPLR